MINFKLTVLIMIFLNLSKNSFEDSESFIFKSLLLLRARWWNIFLGKWCHTFFILFLRFLNCLIIILWFHLILADSYEVIWLKIEESFWKWIFSGRFSWRYTIVNRQNKVLVYRFFYFLIFVVLVFKIIQIFWFDWFKLWLINAW